MVNGTAEVKYGEVAEENPDDAAEEANMGTGVAIPWLGIFHGQFELYPGKGTASPLILVANSCQKYNYYCYSSASS